LRDTRVTDETIGIFAENGQLERVNISRCPRLTNEGIRALVQRCTYLHEIDVSWLSLLTEVAVAHLETGASLISTAKPRPFSEFLILHITLCNQLAI
jgi:hypothetical protein